MKNRDIRLKRSPEVLDRYSPIHFGRAIPLPMAGGESGMFQYPPIGTIVEIAAAGGSLAARNARGQSAHR
ncbi:hypothetical protein FE394_01690 [Xenorhabdus sp. Reich]|uniref:Uncharacterized protein n=1 Tax=Xenorhabdus littoralis TaxID=2582835 RepID=A0ABU4SH79_9GAMM|nr:hypothetical protein [Xenorhabdus sp. Reich]MDX7997939.1 hypothetical protein [Xenorhabdus sp. Reich]